MAKIRIHELAKELGLENKDVIAKCKQLGFEIRALLTALKTARRIVSGRPLGPAKRPLPEEMQIVVERKRSPLRTGSCLLKKGGKVHCYQEED